MRSTGSPVNKCSLEWMKRNSGLLHIPRIVRAVLDHVDNDVCVCVCVCVLTHEVKQPIIIAV